jgi:hypothetical protein
MKYEISILYVFNLLIHLYLKSENKYKKNIDINTKIKLSNSKLEVNDNKFTVLLILFKNISFHIVKL